MDVPFQCVARWWQGRPDPPTAGPFDLIAATSYGSRSREKLATITRLNLLLACKRWRQSQEALLAFANAAFLFRDDGQAEAILKWNLIRERVPEKNIVDAGAMNSTYQEVGAIYQEVVERRKFRPERILVITGEMHVPAARLIWHTFFPWARITIEALDWRHETEVGHPVIFQRSPWLWFPYQIARQVPTWVIAKMFGRRGLEWLGGFHHLTAKA